MQFRDSNRRKCPVPAHWHAPLLILIFWTIFIVLAIKYGKPDLDSNTLSMLCFSPI